MYEGEQELAKNSHPIHHDLYAYWIRKNDDEIRGTKINFKNYNGNCMC